MAHASRDYAQQRIQSNPVTLYTPPTSTLFYSSLSSTRLLQSTPPPWSRHYSSSPGTCLASSCEAHHTQLQSLSLLRWLSRIMIPLAPDHPSRPPDDDPNHYSSDQEGLITEKSFSFVLRTITGAPRYRARCGLPLTQANPHSLARVYHVPCYSRHTHKGIGRRVRFKASTVRGDGRVFGVHKEPHDRTHVDF